MNLKQGRAIKSLLITLFPASIDPPYDCNATRACVLTTYLIQHSVKLHNTEEKAQRRHTVEMLR